MLDEGTDLNTESPTPPEEKSNRTFLVVGGILAALIFLTLVCGAAWVLWLGPSLSTQQGSTKAFILTQNAQVIGDMTSTAQAALWTQTPRPSSTLTITPLPVQRTNTPVVALSSPTATSTTTSDPATLAAMQTQLSNQMTSTAAAQATRGIGGEGMPTTGFFDEVGLPGMIILGLALVAVIFLARRLRRVPSK
jgi:hypothetical protein